MAVAFHPLIVTEIERDTSSSVLVTLECPDTELGFEHGQYLTFRHEIDGVEIRRSYSICSPVDGALRVGIKRVDGGALDLGHVGPARRRHRRGHGADGALHPRTRSAGGPLVHAGRRRQRNHAIYSIAATILDTEPDSIVTLLQVDQATSTIMLLDDIEDLRNRYLDRFRVWRQLTREPQALDLLDGRRASSRSSPASSGACSRLLPIMSSSAAPRR